MSIFRNRENYTESYKAVFSVSIDTNHKYRNNPNCQKQQRESLIPSGKYWFEEERYATYDDLKEFAIGILERELQEECMQFVGVPILDIKVKSIYEGSIELFFIVVFGTLAGVTGIKDLHDSIEFVKMLAEKKLQKRFRRKYGDYFEIDVRCQIPSDKQHWNDCKFLHERNILPFRLTLNGEQPKRDGFFYYLLISNFVLLAIVMVMVLNAVVKVYF